MILRNVAARNEPAIPRIVPQFSKTNLATIAHTQRAFEWNGDLSRLIVAVANDGGRQSQQASASGNEATIQPAVDSEKLEVVTPWS
jgi:hypothetical protein